MKFAFRYILIPTLGIFLLVLLLTLNLLLPAKRQQLSQELGTDVVKGVSQESATQIELLESKVCFADSYNKDLGDPQEIIGYQNNKFGLYIYAEEDYVELAGDLVNSNGGDWGYVLLPINVKDYDGGKWRKIFRRLREKHLIPIIQLWDLSKEDEEDQLKESADFLNQMDWPIESLYISVFNEPNDSKFWRGEANPEEYARVLNRTIDIFKEENEKFFILNGAFNSSARGGDGYIDEREFLVRMNKEVPGIFEKLDGWASHPYPQPNFSGGPSAYGRDSIGAYDWELSLLKNLFGVKDLPVFITETGWAHSEGVNFNNNYLSADVVASLYVKAFEDVWLPDERVAAVTPFTIRYSPPHDHFSWVDAEEKPYPQFKAVQEMEKIEGKPPYRVSEERVCD